MGDAIEVEALKSGYDEIVQKLNYQGQSNRFQKEFPCYISSLKPCIGHAEIASGMAALVKVVMALKNNTIPGLPEFKNLNENISLKDSRLRITAENHKWETLTYDGKKIPRRAAINSYGFGGVNAHALIEEYLTEPLEKESLTIKADEPLIFVLSAKNEERLKAYAVKMEDFLNNQLSNTNYQLPDIAYTLQTGREAMEYRLAIVVRNKQELISGLNAFLQSQKKDEYRSDSISIFTGNKENDYPVIRNILSGEAGEAVLEIFLAKRNLEKLAEYWVKGFDVPWVSLYEGKKLRKISLPTYPFEKRRCWIESGQVSESFEKYEKTEKIIQSAVKTIIPVKDRIIDIVSGLTGVAIPEINPNKSLEEYGFSSILLMQLLQQMQTRIDPLISLEKLSDCRTIQDIVNMVSDTDIEQFALSGMETVSVTTALHRFPELIRLGKGSQGSPVFWFHSGHGGVKDYRVIASKSRRPFYGIQARGIMTERAPLHGIQAMAAYYVHIIQSVQPEGPYDLGGYSLGGVLAYEVTRQLQESGHVVDTIVMLDSMITKEFKNRSVYQKNLMLQAVNMELLSSAFQEPEKISQTLIHHKDLNTNQDDDLFLQELIAMAIKRGLKADAGQLHNRIQQNIKVKQAYEMKRYSLFPLPDPEGVTCYYFRNKNRLFRGELEPYFNMDDNFSLDHINYWEKLEQHIPYFHIMDLDISSHIMLLSEPKSYETICEFCEVLYSGKEISREFLDSFKKRTIEKHGHMPGFPAKTLVPKYTEIIPKTENRNISSILGIASENATETDLMAAAVKETGLSDWGDESFREPLKVLLESYKNESELNLLGHLTTHRTIIECLCNRLRIQQELKQHPEIRQEQIYKPLFIVSLPRTGTTLLQRLLAMDPFNRSPLLWEIFQPAPAPELKTHESDPRIAEVEKKFKEMNQLIPNLKLIHEMGAKKPEECTWLHKNSFVTPSFSDTDKIQGYMEWLHKQNMICTYEYQLVQLQILQFRYPTNRWVLKAPAHMYSIDALLAVFPDACVLQTYREPEESVPSFINLINTIRCAYSDHVESKLLAIERLNFLKHMAERYLKAREDADPDRFCDIYYKSFVKDPVTSVRKIYEYFDYEFSSEFENRMIEWLAENLQHKHGKHIYSLEEFGLDQDMVYSALEKYCTRFGLMK